MRGVNKVILIGNLGADPETRFMPSGTAVTNARIAVGEQWKDRETGEKKERTEWIGLVFFGKLAEIAGEYLRKGAQVYVEGRIRTEKWTDREGATRYTTKVYVDQMLMLGNRESGPARDAGERSERSQAPAPASAPEPASEMENEFEDEFLAHIVLPNGQTMGEFAKPQIAQAYDSGEMPSLLPDPGTKRLGHVDQ